MWVFDNHYVDLLDRLSHSGAIVFLNSATIVFYSKRQVTINFSAFGSKMVALRYKVLMVWVEVLGPTIVFEDNNNMINGGCIPHHTLPKKNLDIFYHAVCEASLTGTWKVGFGGREGRD